MTDCLKCSYIADTGIRCIGLCEDSRNADDQRVRARAFDKIKRMYARDYGTDNPWSFPYDGLIAFRWSGGELDVLPADRFRDNLLYGKPPSNWHDIHRVKVVPLKEQDD